MPNRNLQGDYRYAYQGQEKDPETGKEAFELRLWDSRIGRWLTTDPARVGFSPYVGMVNNPISEIDPDGACPCSQCPENCGGDAGNPDVHFQGSLGEVVINGSGGSSPSLAFVGSIFMEQQIAQQVAQETSKKLLPRVVSYSSMVGLLMLAEGDTRPVDYPTFALEDQDRFLYRGMKAGPDGKPVIGHSSSKLGVRTRKYNPQATNTDIDLYTLHGIDYFKLATEKGFQGMSTSLNPNSPTLRPPIFKIRIGDVISAGLAPIYDNPTTGHVTIGGTRLINEFDSYLIRLNSTQQMWILHNP